MSKINFKRLRFRRLSEIIEDTIRDSVISGELKLGSRLPTEKEISKQFGVSIVTVREALRGLEAFGIIQKKRGREGGIFVSRTKTDFVKGAVYNFLSLSKLSARDLGEVRKIVEPSTAAIAASRMTSDDLEDLKENIKYCESKLKRKSQLFSEEDFFDIEERNVEFHRLIAKATHNPILTLTVDYMMDFLFSYKKRSLVPDISFSNDSVREHRIIYNALRRGNAQDAEQYMLKHIVAVENYLLSK